MTLFTTLTLALATIVLSWSQYRMHRRMLDNERFTFEIVETICNIGAHLNGVAKPDAARIDLERIRQLWLEVTDEKAKERARARARAESKLR